MREKEKWKHVEHAGFCCVEFNLYFAFHSSPERAIKF
jgi:hypothetical protein